MLNDHAEFVLVAGAGGFIGGHLVCFDLAIVRVQAYPGRRRKALVGVAPVL